MPLTLTPTPSATVRYVDSSTYVTITATGNTGTVTFSVTSYPTGSSAGTFTFVSAAVNRWFPPNRVGSYVVHGTDGTNTGDVTITVESVLPILPHWGYDMEVDDKVLVSKAEDNHMIFRLKAAEIRSWNLPFPFRTVTEFTLLHDFWTYHRKHKFFYWEDLGIAPSAVLVHFNSGLKVTVNGPNNLTITCVVEEVTVG